MPLFTLDDHLSNLPATTMEVLRQLGRGESIQEAAVELVLSPSAVRSRLQRFYDEYDVRGRFVVAWSAKHLDCCLAVNTPEG